MSAHASHAVFLSYASEDVAAAMRICEALRAAGVEVWFDQNELVGGDAWDAKIRGQIASCALFVPVISAHTQARLEGYFRLEWKLAAQRTHTMAEEKTFLLPVVIDGTRDADAKVPVEFKAVQWTRLPAGEASAAFVTRVKHVLDGSPMEPGRPRPGERGEGAASPGSPSAPSAKMGRRVPAAAWITATALLIVAIAGASLWLRRDASATTANVVSEKSIAVLPFENRSSDQENAFFTDGIHDDILTSLTRVSDLHVISRTSVMEYRGTAKKIPQIARELGVAFVLEGSVQRSGRSVRITGQLIRADTDQHVWADSYDRELTAANVFAIQSELAKAIAGELKAALLPQEKKLIERPPTASIEAYDCFLKARELRDRFSTDDALVEAEKLLERAVGIDPQFGIAWAKLAWLKGYLSSNVIGADERLARAREAVAKAEQLIPDAPEFFLCRGWVNYSANLRTDYVSALTDFERARKLSPNFAEPPYAIAMVQRRQGRWLQALQNLQTAQRIEPANPEYTQETGILLLAGRRYGEAEAALRRAEALGRSGEFLATYKLLLGLWSRGDLPEESSSQKLIARVGRNIALMRGEPPASTGAAGVVDEALVRATRGERDAVRALLEEPARKFRQQLSPDSTSPGAWANLAMMEALLGNRDEALRCAKRETDLLLASPDLWAVRNRPSALAFVHAWTGDPAGALAELTRSLQLACRPIDTNINVHTLRLHPAWFPLRGDPRFEALLKDPKNNEPLF